MENQNLDLLDINYEPKKIEDKIYEKWIEEDAFKANPNKKKTPFTIVMPPPNVTGKLHMGHALDISLQDTLIRYKRMKGFETLWQPGTDHAAISTEVKVTEKLAKEGIDKKTIGREAFLKEAWKWKEEYEHNIIDQQKKMGASCDWSRLRFTMDEGCSKAVYKTFHDLYKKGLIYKGEKIVNWCPHCHTTISDAEVIYKEQDGKLYHIKYYFKDLPNEYIIVATTRPETMLGDTAVCVNPTDERYKNLIGKKVILPLIGRELEIIADEYVEKDFGSGFVKMTPCHDPNDFLIGQKHNLEKICILDDDAHIMCEGTKYHKMDRLDCRKEIVKDLSENGFIEKIEDYKHNVGVHDRCNTNIEPMVKNQWFVKMEPLAKPAIDVLKKGKLKFIPESFSQTYLHWLNNIRDWCISRQIWWGHRIPVYYCKDCNEIIVSENKVLKCPKCKSQNVYQDEDTLDTWFSSALWPFSTLGWPEKTKEYEYFYPTDVLVTGYDIIFFWVVRMVFSGIEQTKKVPFKEVLIHGIVRDEKGQKMSKSLGNGIDPLDIIDKYGADALRMMLLTGNAPGNDMRFINDRVIASRNFLNKVWNATRYIMMNDDDKYEKILKNKNTNDLKVVDKWILNKLNNTIEDVTKNIDNYDLGIALDKIEKFVWEEFCDWYIEFSKFSLYSKDDTLKAITLKVLKTVLIHSIKLLHPFCPFITEEIYDKIVKDELLIKSTYPEKNKKLNFNKEEKQIEYIKNVIKSIRNIRAELNSPYSKKVSMIVSVSKNIKNIFEVGDTFIKNMCGISEINLVDESVINSKIKDFSKYIILTFDGATCYILFEELVDIEKEKQRLLQEKEKLENEVLRCKNLLNNEKFVSKAPKEKIDEEKSKLEKYEKMLSDVLTNIDKFNK